MAQAGMTVTFCERPLGSGMKVTTSGTSAQSAVMPANTQIVRVVCSAASYISFSADPTADTTTSIYMPAGLVEYFAIEPGEKLAVIQDSAAGTVYVQPMG
jgi:hypothetical protein